MVAMLLSELLQEPPVLGVAVIVEFTQVTLDEVLTTGNGCTIMANGVIFEHPVAVFVYLNVVWPSDSPVTMPALVTVAIWSLELDHTPSVEGVAVMFSPTHTSISDRPTIGKLCTVIVPLVVFEHPVAESV